MKCTSPGQLITAIMTFVTLLLLSFHFPNTVPLVGTEKYWGGWKCRKESESVLKIFIRML